MSPVRSSGAPARPADLSMCGRSAPGSSEASCSAWWPRCRGGEPTPYGVSVHRSLLNRAVVAELHERVEVVMTWPVNDARALADVTEAGVSGVISDEISIVREVMRCRD